ncbi:photosystem I reaction center subunit PsaK [Nostoc sp. LEGE 12447]|uniref:photosystem I reaction center subunit PsaK n=1 Tax=Nostoc sp. LEGE 12447 TaxID=1828640 RepID=UPI00188396DF|nr:photosystem I reaction center subunit PsaK [Nostoc sp. LEGE 12447]MBE9000485.1 photosystem I reaction center subunit PsaK [Nostoc sp. LEGE 12447]
MISSILLAAAATVPATPAWNPTVGIIISISSLVMVLLSTRIEKPLVGPKFPILPISIPTFVGAMAFGHIVGVGIVLGLTNIGRL